MWDLPCVVIKIQFSSVQMMRWFMVGHWLYNGIDLDRIKHAYSVFGISDITRLSYALVCSDLNGTTGRGGVRRDAGGRAEVDAAEEAEQLQDKLEVVACELTRVRVCKEVEGRLHFRARRQQPPRVYLQ